MNLIGAAGTVVSTIPENGYGEVSLALGHTHVVYLARSKQPQTMGTKVMVTDVLGLSTVEVQTL